MSWSLSFHSIAFASILTSLLDVYVHISGPVPEVKINLKALSANLKRGLPFKLVSTVLLENQVYVFFSLTVACSC